jgi:hypothetical protein
MALLNARHCMMELKMWKMISNQRLVEPSLDLKHRILWWWVGRCIYLMCACSGVEVKNIQDDDTLKGAKVSNFCEELGAFNVGWLKTYS